MLGPPRQPSEATPLIDIAAHVARIGRRLEPCAHAICEGSRKRCETTAVELLASKPGIIRFASLDRLPSMVGQILVLPKR